MIQRHCEHSFNMDMIRPNGWCMDVGCRDFQLAHKIRRESRAGVIAVDADPSIMDVPIDAMGKINYHNAAVVGDELAANRKQTRLHLHPSDPQAHTIVASFPGDRGVMVPTTSVQNLMRCYQIEQLDLLKLDCEGAEYEIMRSVAFWAKQGKPLARQISVEYHDHCGLNPVADMNGWYDRLHASLVDCYEITKHEREVPPWGGAPHFVDSLYTLRMEHWR